MWCRAGLHRLKVFNPLCAIGVHGFVVATVFGPKIDIIAIGVSTL